MPEKIYDVVIVGSGPAGCCAAIYTARGGASTLVVAGEKSGGQLMLTSQVENFPGFPEGIMGPDLMVKMRKQAERFGAVFLDKNINEVDFGINPFVLRPPAQVGGSDSEFRAKTVIIATGASSVWLGIPGEKELIGRGVSTCASCDAPFFKNKKVAVAGGGDTAMEDALILAKFASEVTIVHRREEFRASEIMQKKVLGNSKIKVMWNTEVTKINGEEKVESLNLANNKTKETTQLPIDGVFVAIGHKPDSGLFKGKIRMDENGFIKIAHPYCQTSIPGVFAAGDVTDPFYRQAITSAGSGCAAALEALKYLQEKIIG